MVPGKVNMWAKLVIVFSWTLLVHGQYYDDLDTLGDRISASVRAQVAPLEGLGERINAQVQRSLQPMQVNLNNRLSELDGLGDRINQQVYDNLEPVRAIELNFKMRDGVGGATVVTHSPSGRQFIKKNYRLYTCTTKIDTTTGTCSGSLNPFEITSSSSKSDWCFVQSYSLVNNKLCLSTGSVNVQVINNNINCRSNDGSPIFQIDLDEYKRLCSGVRESTEFRYIPDESDSGHVAIPNQNKFVKCENQQRNLCVFHENNPILSTFSSGGTTVFIQNGGSVITSGNI